MAPGIVFGLFFLNVYVFKTNDEKNKKITFPYMYEPNFILIPILLSAHAPFILTSSHIPCSAPGSAHKKCTVD